MHSLLEEYLSELAGQLNALPSKRRTEELREVRTHLENAMLAAREKGQTEEEAVRVAVAQYGAVGVVGQEMTAALRQEVDLNVRGMVSAAVCTMAVTAALARMGVLFGTLLPPAPA